MRPYSLSPVLRGEGRGEGTGAPLDTVRFRARVSIGYHGIRVR
jgi:hypothetical protein